MSTILKINLRPMLAKLDERETEPGGERKGAERGEGGPHSCSFAGSTGDRGAGNCGNQ